MRFRAVFFDAGETLVHPSPSFPELFSRVLGDAGHRRDPAAVSDASAAVFRRFAEAADDGGLWTTSPERSARFWKGSTRRCSRTLTCPPATAWGRALPAFTDPGTTRS
jgi:FMN phosphatase YigB (HAD superfamily)